MCVPFDAEPPVAPIAGAAVSHALLELEAADAPHSVFDRRFEEHADASEDAWRRVLDFIRAHTPARA